MTEKNEEKAVEQEDKTSQVLAELLVRIVSIEAILLEKNVCTKEEFVAQITKCVDQFKVELENAVKNKSQVLQ